MADRRLGGETSLMRRGDGDALLRGGGDRGDLVDMDDTESTELEGDR